MVRKIGIYQRATTSGGEVRNYIKVKFKNGMIPETGGIVTDDMIEDYKDPLWYKLVDVIYANRECKNNGELADEILKLLEEQELNKGIKGFL